jgi:hypothetical protein
VASNIALIPVFAARASGTRNSMARQREISRC